MAKITGSGLGETIEKQITTRPHSASQHAMRVSRVTEFPNSRRKAFMVKVVVRARYVRQRFW